LTNPRHLLPQLAILLSSITANRFVERKVTTSLIFRALASAPDARSWLAVGLDEDGAWRSGALFEFDKSSQLLSVR
jgi:hypothetical protein